MLEGILWQNTWQQNREKTSILKGRNSGTTTKDQTKANPSPSRADSKPRISMALGNMTTLPVSQGLRIQQNCLSCHTMASLSGQLLLGTSAFLCEHPMLPASLIDWVYLHCNLGSPFTASYAAYSVLFRGSDPAILGLLGLSCFYRTQVQSLSSSCVCPAPHRWHMFLYQSLSLHYNHNGPGAPAWLKLGSTLLERPAGAGCFGVCLCPGSLLSNELLFLCTGALGTHPQLLSYCLRAKCTVSL